MKKEKKIVKKALKDVSLKSKAEAIKIFQELVDKALKEHGIEEK